MKGHARYRPLPTHKHNPSSKPQGHNMGDGYKRKSAPNHPLAMANGNIQIHRQKLWDHLHPNQPDPFETFDHCHWCGWQIPWRTHHHPQWKHSINVDHLDSNRTNNNIDNLTPSCGWCNNNRHWLSKDPIFQVVFKAQQQQPPQHRTNPTRLANQITGTAYTKPQQTLEAH